MSQEDQATHEVLVTFLSDSSYNAATKAWFVPSGTRLIGQWLPDQPDTDTFDIQTAGIHWGIAAGDVSLLCPLGKTWERGLQARFAAEDRALAKRQAEAGELEAAQRLYAQAVIERAACGDRDADLADIRAERAALLLKLKKIDEAIAEYEQAARPHEALVSSDIQMFRLEHAQSAAFMLMFLCEAYLWSPKKYTAEKLQLVDRMVEINRIIKKRYEVKVSLLLDIAELLHDLQNNDQATKYLLQAERFYSQQLVHGWGTDGIRMQLDRLKREIPTQAERSMTCTVTATTIDELELILDHLREHVPGLTVTRGVQGTRPKDWRSATQYTARLRFLIADKQEPSRIR